MASKVAVRIFNLDGTIKSTEIVDKIDANTIAMIREASGGALIEKSGACKRPLPASAKRNQADEEYIEATLGVSKGSKTTIACPFHKDATPSAQVTHAFGFKCFSSNCVYGNKYMPRAQFAAALRLLKK